MRAYNDIVIAVEGEECVTSYSPCSESRMFNMHYK